MSKDLRYSPPEVGTGSGITHDVTVKQNGTTKTTDARIFDFLGQTINVNASGTYVSIYIAGVLRGQLANRPAANAAPNVLYIAYDIPMTSYSDGSSWYNEIIDINAGTTGTLDLDRGGTGATTAMTARANLGLGSAATHDATDFDAAGAAATAQSNAEAFATAADTVVLTTAETYADTGDTTTLTKAENFAIAMAIALG